MADVRIMIVDDEPLARERLEQLVNGLPGYAVDALCNDARSAMDVLQLRSPEVVLLDISMPGMSGLDLARYIAGMEAPPAIIYCTAHDEHALAAFDTGATAYLLKPVREGKLLEALESARRVNRMQMRAVSSQENTEENENFCIDSHRGVELIPVSLVSHLVADQKYVTLYHRDGEALMESSLKAIEEAHPDTFIRIHRNTLANVDYIAGIRRNASGEAFLRLKNVREEPLISRRHLKNLKQFLTSK
jgi:two-component system, LytTR family, response regulator AlgR